MKEFIYFALRIPKALLGLVLVAMPFIPNFNDSTQQIDPLILICAFILGCFILAPNHLFTSVRLRKIRLISCALIGAVFAGYAFYLGFVYLTRDMDFILMLLAGYFLYIALALPISVWLNAELPEVGTKKKESL